MPLDEDSRRYVTVDMHQGLHRYMRLKFGVASAPALFQKLMNTVLQRIPGAARYIDKIFISTGRKTTFTNPGGSIQEAGGTSAGNIFHIWTNPSSLSYAKGDLTYT